MSEGVGRCNICNNVYTTAYIETENDSIIFICATCVERSKNNFIWICKSCGKTYVQPKNLVITRIKDPELKKAYMLCEDMQVIQSIDECISCTPERLFEVLDLQEAGMDC